MMNLDEFDTVIRRKDSRTIAMVPQLSLYAQGPDVSSALEALERKKLQLRDELAEGEIGPDLIAKSAGLSYDHPLQRNPGDVSSFSIKAAILIVLLTLAGAIVFQLVFTELKQIIEQSRTAIESSVRQQIVQAQADLRSGLSLTKPDPLWDKVTNRLSPETFRDVVVTPEQEKLLLANLDTIVQRWRPFVAKALEVFPDKSCGPR